MTGALVSASEVSGVLLLSGVRGPFVDNNIALANKIVFECQLVVVMCPDFFQETPWVTVDVDNPKKDDDDNKDFVDRDAEGRTYKEWRSLHNNYRFNVDVSSAAATLIKTVRPNVSGGIWYLIRGRKGVGGGGGVGAVPALTYGCGRIRR